MDLDPAGRKFYTLQLEPTLDGAPDETVDVSGYEASFDSGVTYVEGTLNVTTTWYEWLVAGPDFPASNDVSYTPLAKGVQPKVRLIDTPEVIIEKAPRIYIRG